MVTKTSYEPGTPSWVDLMTPDVATSAKFYSDLFGWTVVDPGPEAGGYQMFELDGKTVAGVGPIQNPDMPASWQTYVTVSDADETCAKVTAAGGTIYAPPFDVMTAGRMAVFADSTGAVLAVWEPRDHIGCELVNEPGTLIWNELNTRNVEESTTFYPEVFGWVAGETPGAENYTTWLLNGEGIGGLIEMNAQWPDRVPNHWMVYFCVANLDESIARAQELGATVVVPSFPAGPGVMAVFHDAVGASFSLLEVTA